MDTLGSPAAFARLLDEAANQVQAKGVTRVSSLSVPLWFASCLAAWQQRRPGLCRRLSRWLASDHERCLQPCQVCTPPDEAANQPQLEGVTQELQGYIVLCLYVQGQGVTMQMLLCS